MVNFKFLVQANLELWPAGIFSHPPRYNRVNASPEKESKFSTKFASYSKTLTVCS